MILFFTGTGNSRYTAEYIGNLTNDKTVNINQLIRAGKKGGKFTSQKPFVFVSPAYAWRIPRIFRDFIAASTFLGSKSAYFILTCGSDIGNAGKYAARQCSEKGLDFKGAAPIIMPENYIARYEAPAPEEAERILTHANTMIKTVAERIDNMADLGAPIISIGDRLKSGIVNCVFYPFIVKASGFYSTAQCVGCGKCEKACPLNNITIRKNRPNWEDQCTHCMACICRCPNEAIEYKKVSHGKERYYNNLAAPKE